MIEYKIEIISAEVSKTLGSLENVVTHLIWQYSLTVNDIKESLMFRTVLNPPKKKGFVKIDDVTKLLMVSWVEASADLDDSKKQLDDFFEYQQKQNTFIYIPKI